MEFRSIILAKYPNVVFPSEQRAKSISIRKGLLATLKMYNQKKKELSHIIEVEVPQNSKEIGTALALGDLKENAEYHAAKEKQAILSATVTNLEKDISNATVIKPEDVDLGKIGFGTVVTLENLVEKKNEKITILGPWESDPEHNVISYLSPLGEKLLNRQLNEELNFTINERNYHYVVKKIELSQF